MFQTLCMKIMCVQALMTVATLLLYMALKCRPKDYEEFCTLLGASCLWFITLPLALCHWLNNRQWKKEQKAKWEEQ
jgi:ABC-type Fe3+ transport system permease subunit